MKIERPTKPLADVNVLPQSNGDVVVVACFMPDPDLLVGEGDSRAVLALDGSRSIKRMFGFGGPFGGDPNYVQLVARKLGEVLCGVSSEGEVSMIYWALGSKGADIETIGDFDEDSCEGAKIGGPKKKKWGRGTRMLPPIQYIAEVATRADWTMGVIVTDGIIQDEKECMDYCFQLGRDIASGKLKELKLVLIGVGEEVDAGQLERFDDMFEGTDLEDTVDIWSHGIAASFEDEADIMAVLFGELMTEDTIIADTGKVLDDQGRPVMNYNDGVPGKLRFVLPRGARAFTVQTPKGDVTQDISEALEIM